MKSIALLFLSTLLLTSCSTTNNRIIAGNFPHGDVLTKVRFVENFLDKENNVYKCMDDICKYIEFSSLNDTYLSIKMCTIPFSQIENLNAEQTIQHLKNNFSGQTCTSLLDNHLITENSKETLDNFLNNQPFANKSGVRKYLVLTGTFVAGAVVAMIAGVTAPATIVGGLVIGGVSGLAASGTATIAHEQKQIGQIKIKEEDISKLSAYIDKESSHLILIGEAVQPNIINNLYKNNKHFKNFERNVQKFSSAITGN